MQAKNRVNVNVIIIKLIIKILRFQQLVRYSMNGNGWILTYIFFPHSYTVVAKKMVVVGWVKNYVDCFPNGINDGYVSGVKV